MERSKTGTKKRSPDHINQPEKPRRWGRVGESEMGGATVMLPYAGHQMLNFTLI